MKVILDTCVISEVISQRPAPQVLAFLDSLEPDLTYLSVITIGEIVKGIEKLPDSQRKTRLREWLRTDLLVRFDEQILPLDTMVLLQWGALTARLEALGKTMPAMDSLIAATAFSNQMTLVTRNVSDFEATGVEIINPWS